jgi:outer membrane immunogenic protein
MKKLSFIGLLAIAGAGLNAQAPIKSGEKQLNAGVGISSWGNPVYAGLEFGLPNDFSAGFQGMYESYKHAENRFYKYKHSIFTASGFANYHFNRVFKMPSQWDLYAGLSLNYFIFSDQSEYVGPAYLSDDMRRNNRVYSPSNEFGFSGQIGGRYFFTKSFGINLEGNTGSLTHGGKFGITYKF